MSKKTKFTNGLAIALLFGVMANGQSSVLELTTGAFNSLSVPGSGFGPDSSRMVATFEKDLINNSHFTTYTTGAGNAVTTTFAFQNQRYTGLGYGCNFST